MRKAYRQAGRFAFKSASKVQLGLILRYIWELLYDSESSQLTDSTGDQLLTREIEN